jgi:hypothetical protein
MFVPPGGISVAFKNRVIKRRPKKGNNFFIILLDYVSGRKDNQPGENGKLKILITTRTNNEVFGLILSFM